MEGITIPYSFEAGQKISFVQERVTFYLQFREDTGFISTAYGPVDVKYKYLVRVPEKGDPELYIDETIALLPGVKLFGKHKFPNKVQKLIDEVERLKDVELVGSPKRKISIDKFPKGTLVKFTTNENDLECYLRVDNDDGYNYVQTSVLVHYSESEGRYSVCKGSVIHFNEGSFAEVLQEFPLNIKMAISVASTRVTDDYFKGDRSYIISANKIDEKLSRLLSKPIDELVSDEVNLILDGSVTKNEENVTKEPKTVPETKENVTQHDEHGTMKYYNESRIEAMVMMERVWGTEAAMTFCEMNALKYRYPSKTE